MRFVVLVNGGAGSVDDAEDAEELAAIDLAFSKAGAEANVDVVAPADFQRVMTDAWAASTRPDAIVVAGGDGTVNCAADVAAGTDIVLAVLPMGTFDHFAKDLGMPTVLDEAAAAIAGGTVREVDVAEVNGRVFVNNSALGAYPAMVADRDRLRDAKGWGKVRAVPVAALAVWRDLPLHRLTLQGPGFEREHVRTPFVFIGNGVYDNAHFGTHEREGLESGVLGVAVGRVVSRWGLLRMVVSALVRGDRSTRDLDTAELTDLTIDAHTRRLRVSLDGEVEWFDTPLRYRSRTGALRVLAPPVLAPGGPETEAGDRTTVSP